MTEHLPPVLLVEDDEVLAAIVSELLADTADVMWAASAEAALAVARVRPWDLVIADIELPGMSGIELVGRLKGVQPDLATLIVSGRTTFDDAVAAIRAGADDYLTKPIDGETLVGKATELIARARWRRAHEALVVER